MTDERGVDAVERAFRLLECFDGEAEALSLAELSRRSGLYKSTILRLSQSMARFGYMIRGDDGRYRLGPTLWRLGARYRRRLDLAEIIRPELRRLAAATGESASFYVRDGDVRVCLYRENAARAARHHLEEGQRLELGKGAPGRVLTAFSSPADTAGAAVRAAGHAVSLGERDPDVAAVAVPVVDAAGELVGALSVSGLIGRFDDGRRVAALQELTAAAGRVERALGAPAKTKTGI